MAENALVGKKVKAKRTIVQNGHEIPAGYEGTIKNVTTSAAATTSVTTGHKEVAAGGGSTTQEATSRQVDIPVKQRYDVNWPVSDGTWEFVMLNDDDIEIVV
ncbi:MULTISPECIES: hypothetical protein [unclassified Streptomyces]|uniref:hypothetical protein n=1 Tax=unclassified Streptomyces TaxID=2593676 RepID=UPI00382521B0